MLSATEYHRAKYDFEHIPSSMTGKRRQNYRSHLRKRIKEHEYASRFPPFNPPVHRLYFINRVTAHDVIQYAIDAANSSTLFTMDSESVNVVNEINRPALLQLQILRSSSSSIVLLVEVNHLPDDDSREFLMIRHLFSVVFHPTKEIYLWGNNEELNGFTTFRLFSIEQVRAMNTTNLQVLFQQYWKQTHAHATTNDYSTELILDHDHNHLWSLQDAVASALHEWIDKRETRSGFNIGLDPALFRRNTHESQTH